MNGAPPPAKRVRWRPLSGCALLLVAVLVVFKVACGSTRRHASGPNSLVAFAFRDHVPGYQKYASEKFALHYLEQEYDEVQYLEATASDDGQARLLAAIEQAALTHDEIDLFFLSHGNSYVGWLSTLTVNARTRVRFVYDTGAGDSRQGPAWLAGGTTAFVGHPSGNVAPLFLRFFLPCWVDGKKLKTCVDDANRDTKDEVMGGAAKALSVVLDAVGGPHLDRAKLWAGTEAVIYGDDSLVVRRPGPRPP
ncbi:MAG: hypothetical protein U0228_35385 [Myxococcaceae bacterium]